MIDSILPISDKFIAPKLYESIRSKSRKISGALRASAFFLALAARKDMQDLIKNGVGFEVHIKGSGLNIKLKERVNDGGS